MIKENNHTSPHFNIIMDLL